MKQTFRKTIKLRESEQKRMIAESVIRCVRKVLKENNTNTVYTNENTPYEMYCPECGAPINHDNSYYDKEYGEVVYMCPKCGADCSFEQLEFVPVN